MHSAVFKEILDNLATGKYLDARDQLLSLKPRLESDTDIQLYEAIYRRLELSIAQSAVLSPIRNESIKLGDTLSLIDTGEPKVGVSIVTCCMNRNDNLANALLSWVKLPVDEIIIVDWSSAQTVEDSIRLIDDPRIKIIRVEGEKRWVLSYGFNVGLRFASYSTIYKLDADIQVADSFLEKNEIRSNELVRGHWKAAIEQGKNDQVYVNGSFGANKKHLRDIAYYNEYIRTYGWDDSDLYERIACQAGAATKILDVSTVHHQEQDEADRLKNQDVSRKLFLNCIEATDFKIQYNKYIGRNTEYWGESLLQDYSVIGVNQKVVSITRKTKDRNIPDHIRLDAGIYATLFFLWRNARTLIERSRDNRAFSCVIYNEFSFDVSFDETLTMLGEINKNSIVVLDESDSLSVDENLAQIDRPIIFIKIGSEYSSRTYADSRVIFMKSDLLEEVLYFRELNGVATLKSNEYLKMCQDKVANVNKVSSDCLYIDAQHGLGNRLRAIGSAAAIAKSEGKRLVIVWEADHHCECEFLDLFDYQGEVITRSFLDKAIYDCDVFNYMEIEPNSDKGAEVFVRDGRAVYLRSAYTLSHASSSWDAENEFIKSLTPTMSVKKIYDDISTNGRVGVHIRMEAGAGLDNNTYDSVDNWTEEGHQELHYWRSKSHYSVFIQKIDDILKEDPSTTFFLAADMPEIYKIISAAYGDRISMVSRSVYDRSGEQIKYALADAILLSRCDRLLGSTWSSFSELALRLSSTFKSIEMSGKDF